MSNGNAIQELLDRLVERDQAGDVSGCIAACEQILDLLPRERIPELWATIQGTLADKLLQRSGQDPDSSERALQHYELALQALTEESNGPQWAANHGQAGNLYMTRRTGERSANLARATDHFRDALRVFDRHPGTMDWAATHASLGEALAELGVDREKVIQHLEAALTVIDGANKPSTWLRSKITLAHAYATRGPDGNTRAVALLREALPALPGRSHEERGALHAWIGQYRRESVGGDTAAGEDETLAAFESALAEFRAAGADDLVKRTHAQLGHTYAHRVAGDRADNVARAIQHLETAVEMSDENDPGWGHLNAALGILYDDPALH